MGLAGVNVDQDGVTITKTISCDGDTRDENEAGPTLQSIKIHN
jgi:hypothetical protein